MVYKKLSEISINNKGYYGIGASSCERKQDLPQYLRITDISDDGRIPSILPTCIDKIEYSDYCNYILSKGDLLLARTGNSTGRNHLYKKDDKNTVFAGFLIKFSLDDKLINPYYVGYYCQSKSYNNQIEAMVTGSTRPNINAEQYGDLLIPVCDSTTQQHIVDSIGSVDDAIEKNEEIIDKIYSFLTNKFNELVYDKNAISFGDLKYWNIVKSGIDKFEGNKIYIDTSSVSNKSIIDTNYNITYVDRPSRANMQPLPNTVWFAKLKDSPKYIIVKNSSKRILNNYVLSTGFMGLEAADYIINYLYLLILSSSFSNQKDASSTGATMMGINNDILYSIKVPNITKSEACSFGKEIDIFIETIIRLQEKNYILKTIKKNLLSKYFD